jgi:hypothetical protein
MVRAMLSDQEDEINLKIRILLAHESERVVSSFLNQTQAPAMCFVQQWEHMRILAIDMNIKEQSPI